MTTEFLIGLFTGAASAVVIGMAVWLYQDTKKRHRKWLENKFHEQDKLNDALKDELYHPPYGWDFSLMKRSKIQDIIGRLEKLEAKLP